MASRSSPPRPALGHAVTCDQATPACCPVRLSHRPFATRAPSVPGSMTLPAPCPWATPTCPGCCDSRPPRTFAAARPTAHSFTAPAATPCWRCDSWRCDAPSRGGSLPYLHRSLSTTRTCQVKAGPGSSRALRGSRQTCALNRRALSAGRRQNIVATAPDASAQASRRSLARVRAWIGTPPAVFRVSKHVCSNFVFFFES
jgi:hypothetical protein